MTFGVNFAIKSLPRDAEVDRSRSMHYSSSDYAFVGGGATLCHKINVIVKMIPWQNSGSFWDNVP